MAAAIDGVGIAFAVEQTVREAIADGSLVTMLDRWCARFPGYHLCWAQQRQMSPALRAFIDTVRRAAASQNPSPRAG